jgi:hypothetical protein
MSRRSGIRGYLQQLAQPVAPGETVLKARPGAAHAIETVPPVPVIEDHFEMQDGARTVVTRGAARARREPPAFSQEHSAPAIKDLGARKDVDPGAGAVAQTPAKSGEQIAARRPKQHASDAGHSEPVLPPAPPLMHNRHAGDSSLPSARMPIERVQSGESSFGPTARAEQGREVADQKVTEPVRTPRSSRAEESAVRHEAEPRPALRTEPVSDLVPALRETATTKLPPSQFTRQDYQKERTAIEPVTEAASTTRARLPEGRHEVRADAGPRVHIGTVEVRMSLPQPPAPPPAPIAPTFAQNNGATQARGRSGAAEPLARGLEWSYGLVQG